MCGRRDMWGLQDPACETHPTETVLLCGNKLIGEFPKEQMRTSQLAWAAGWDIIFRSHRGQTAGCVITLELRHRQRSHRLQQQHLMRAPAYVLAAPVRIQLPHNGWESSRGRRACLHMGGALAQCGGHLRSEPAGRRSRSLPFPWNSLNKSVLLKT